MKSSEPAINIIQEFLSKKHLIEDSKKNNLNDRNIIFEKELTLKEINFSYKKKINVFKNDINIKINKGEFIGIKGATGSGKTTLINIISTLLKPTKGQLLLDNKNIYEYNLSKVRQKISLVPQHTFLLDRTIIENIIIGSDIKNLDLNKINEIFKITCLDEFIHNLDEKENYRVGQFGVLLSGGQKQRIGIARALFRDTDIVILDEPSSALDKNTEKKLFENLKKIKKTLIVISHSDQVLEYCDNIIEL